MRNVLVRCFVVVAFVTAPSPAQAQAPALPFGTPVSATTSTDGPAVFELQADGAGILTVSVYTSSDADMFLQATDGVGQSIATADADLSGKVGAEAMSVILPRAGTYRVLVSSRSGATPFEIVAAWLPAPGAEVAADPDGMPTAANALTLGIEHADTVGMDGDDWDWFALTLASDGLVTVLVEAAEGDLALELYRAEDFGTAAERSDRDLEGNAGHEAITTRGRAGETLYFKVVPVFTMTTAIAYTVRAGAM